MNLTPEELEDYLKGMEEQANDVTTHLASFFDSIERNTRRLNPKGRGKQDLFNTSPSEFEYSASWSVPEDETKQAQLDAWSTYELWYVQAEELVEEYRPSRVDVFTKGFSDFKSMLFLKVDPEDYTTKSLYSEITDIFYSQRSTVNSLPAKVEIQKFKAKRQISARMARDEIQRARELFADSFIRSSGVVAAVALERHLLTMCEESDSVTEYKPNHGISRLAQTLYESDVIDKTTWSDLKSLASIRETCAHPEDPGKEAVRRLINDSEEFIRSLRV